MDDKLCEDKLTELYRTLREKYGFSLLNLTFNYTHYKAATRAGWDNSQIVLNIGHNDILKNGWIPGLNHYLLDEWGVHEASFNPPWPAGIMKCDPNDYLCKGPGYTLPKKNPRCKQPTFWDFYVDGCLALGDALKYGLEAHLTAFESDRLKMQSKYGNVGNGGPFFAFYMDEPYQPNVVRDFDILTGNIFGNSTSLEYGYTWWDYLADDKSGIRWDVLASFLKELVIREREKNNPFYRTESYSTQFWVSGYNTWLHPYNITRTVVTLGEMVWYSGYKNMGVRELIEFPLDLLGLASFGYDQTSEWDKMKSLGINGSGWISLQDDSAKKYEFSNRPVEYENLLRHASNLGWSTLGVFGGNDEMPCDKFFHELDIFSAYAAKMGWLIDDSIYKMTRKTWYCWEPECNCNPALPDGWKEYPPAGFSHKERFRDLNQVGELSGFIDSFFF